MLNIVIPMVGGGNRYAESFYETPKPLTDIFGHPMIEYVTQNIRPKCEHRFIFVCQEDHIDRFELDRILRKIAPDCKIIATDVLTEGDACTALLAEELIDNDDELMIASCDQIVDTNIDAYLDEMRDFDGLIMTTPANQPKWSYVKYDENGQVTFVREQEDMSNEAIVGIYNFKRGSDFVKYAYRMIANNVRENNEFSVAPVYNEMINDGMRISFCNVGADTHGFGGTEGMSACMQLDLCTDFF